MHRSKQLAIRRYLFTLFSLLVLFTRHCNSNTYTMFIIIIDRKELKMKSVHAELNPGGKPKVDVVISLWLAKSASE